MTNTKTLVAIKKALTVGTSFNDVVNTVKALIDDTPVEISAPTDDMYGVIIIGDRYGYFLYLEFDVDDTLEVIDFMNADEFDE